MTNYHDIVVVGAGFSGLCVASRLKAAGFSSIVILEKSDRVGGTWRDNSYPGCACDVPSSLYSLSFADKWSWSGRYGTQPEILSYLEDFARHSGLLPHLRFNHEVIETQWDESRRLWVIDERDGRVTLARTLIFSVGALHLPSIPDIEGLEHFRGRAFHSAHWKPDVSLQGQRFGIIGTGASAIQIVPKIAPLVGNLSVFQRTPPWILPRGERSIGEQRQRQLLKQAARRRLSRFTHYAARELLILALRKRGLGTALLERTARAHLRRQVSDSRLRAAMTPRYSIGCKRILLSSDYYAAFNRDNVSLITDPIASVTENSIVTHDGRHHAVDVIVYCTGFRPNGFFKTIKVVGRQGELLDRAWSDVPLAYLGISTRGFPNLFFMTGPNTGLGHSSLLLMIEAQADHIVGAHQFMRHSSCERLEVRADIQRAFFSEMHHRLGRTVWQTGGCQSWYQSSKGVNVALWPGTTREYRSRARRFSPEAYTTSPLPLSCATNATEPITRASMNSSYRVKD